MYNKLLDTFLVAAECGSFSKTGERLHISAMAVVKQINQLEDEIGVQLFLRTSRGVALTAAGKAFREESKALIRASQDAMRRVQRIDARSTHQIRLGTSALRSARYFLNMWASTYGSPLEQRVHIVPFLDNSFEDYLGLLRNLGKNVDVIATVYTPEKITRHCNILEIARLPICCAIPSGHPLADRQVLELNDLHGENLIILQKGLSGDIDKVWVELEKYPAITLVETDEYEPATFNLCETTRQLLLTTWCWTEVHPMLKTVPISCAYDVPYGLLYAKEPSEDTRNFIDFIQKSLKKGHG